MSGFVAKSMPLNESLDRRVIGWWLLGLCGMLLIMVVLGGITRLTGSGLSMVDWRPLTGWLPPLNTQEWHAVFDLSRVVERFRRSGRSSLIHESSWQKMSAAERQELHDALNLGPVEED